MKIGTIPTLILEKEEKEQLTLYLKAIKTLSQDSLCGVINCDNIACSECPFTKLTDLDVSLDMELTKFLSEYRALQRKNPDLPPID